MGGAAFAHAVAHGQPTLRTPRMAPELYESLKKIYLERLQDFFPNCPVTQLREAPEKKDYGDIDLLVGTGAAVDPMLLGCALGAASVLSDGGLHMLAVPRTGAKHSACPVRYTSLKSHKNRQPAAESEVAYAQIDIDVIDPDLFEWHAFFASYGDLAGLLGQIMHNLGFTVSDKGVLLRLKELDDAKRNEIKFRVRDKDGLLFLSNDSDKVMHFLGLDVTRYREGFETMNGFFAWLSQCRFLTPDYVGNLQYKRKDNANQRQKEHKRPMITNFFTEYLPSHMTLEPRQTDDTEARRADLDRRRQQYREEAIEFFGKREDCDELLSNLTVSIANQRAEHLIKPIVLKHYGGSKDKAHEIVRAFRRWVGFEEGQAKILEHSHSDEESQLRFWLDGDALQDAGAVDAWIRDNWAQCKALEREKR